MTPDDPRHGTTAGYDQHCRTGVPACKPCRSAAAMYENLCRLDRMAGRPRTVPAVGTSRRIQALVCLGYTFGEIADTAGVSWDMVAKWCHREGVVRRGSAAAIRRAFTKLCMTPPPQTTGRDKWRRSYARTVARKNGWLPPLAWDDIDNDPEPPTAEPVELDEVVVERILAGERLDATATERAEVVRRWLAAGRPLAQLEAQTGWNANRERIRATREVA
ncbi:MAG: hypothetical protein H6515_14415 [Microthrixaceae bacterium]|nr:hypothetical protein [Microthrixaceae bacterium]